MSVNFDLQFKKLFEKQLELDTLRMITCGSVDDGKSTLIGRMLYDSSSIFEDQLLSLRQDSKKFGNSDGSLDLSLLVDGLSSEREQGITIDVAYRYFATAKRKFIVADTPGHTEYTRNMVTGASTASAAILLVDATKGLSEQTRRHSHICNLVGVKDIIVAVNKMDLVDYSKQIFESIKSEFLSFANKLTFHSIQIVPVCAVNGANIFKRSQKLSWYKGNALMTCLEKVSSMHENETKGFYFPVQLVNRPDANFRGYSGRLLGGSMKPGDKVRLMPSNIQSTVKNIWVAGSCMKSAFSGASLTIEISDDVSVSRGDVFTSLDRKLEFADQFEADLVWVDQKCGVKGEQYLLKIEGQTVEARVTRIKFELDVNSGNELAASTLKANSINRVAVLTNRKICFSAFEVVPELGRFILIDPYSFKTLAVGMIRFAFRRTKNISVQSFDVNREIREQLNGHRGKIFWFTGLSGSGKSTIANEFIKLLHSRGVHTYILDGDNVRSGVNKDLGFGDSDRIENIRRIAEIGKMFVEAGMVVVVASISPFGSDRHLARSLFAPDDFFEVFIDTPMAICEKRDPKGLYRKARKGEIPNFTGIGSRYEKPVDPDIHIETSLNSPAQSARLLFDTFIDRIM